MVNEQSKRRKPKGSRQKRSILEPVKFAEIEYKGRNQEIQKLYKKKLKLEKFSNKK